MRIQNALAVRAIKSMDPRVEQAAQGRIAVRCLLTIPEVGLKRPPLLLREHRAEAGVLVGLRLWTREQHSGEHEDEWDWQQKPQEDS